MQHPDKDFTGNDPVMDYMSLGVLAIKAILLNSLILTDIACRCCQVVFLCILY